MCFGYDCGWFGEVQNNLRLFGGCSQMTSQMATDQKNFIQ